MRLRFALLAIAALPASAWASAGPTTVQWIALVAMITSLVTIPLYAVSAAVFLRLIKRGRLASTRLAHAVPMGLFVAYALVRAASGSIEGVTVVLGLFVGWLCASAPYTLLVQWFWEHTHKPTASAGPSPGNIR